MDDSLSSQLRTEYQKLAMAEKNIWSAQIEMTPNPMKKEESENNKSVVAVQDKDYDLGHEEEQERLRRLSSTAPEIHRRESGGVITIAGMD